ncbi:DNA repair protein XRCC4-like [Selaginella moellendorffii]|uniref:DNA repair protein XRCC4-like n=1 Tax=Selaginella moellendorffii TaxID=88036 RepID=UPI000D1C748F|nr:DNA repair protein XRCC4-like [Selaginella moellendorffii]XP_024540155.1 DNA repair protein XRCC4-like [Selaginella moellendorffii]|eukprot:XP_024518213.1 DNA repair protein XRCC4-like [Selaginella moellendorffii]
MEGEVTCARLRLQDDRSVYARVQWTPGAFTLDVSDGFQAWSCSPSRDMIEDRASQWDQSVADYLRDVRSRLSEHQASSVYKLETPSSNEAKLSWTIQRAGTTLESRWKLIKSADSKAINCQILDFVLEADTKIREELKNKTRLFNSMKAEVDKYLEQNKRLVQEKNQSEEELIRKFVALLNSKKAKLRELQLAVPTPSRRSSSGDDDEEEEATDREDNGDEEDDDQSSIRMAASPSQQSISPKLKQREIVPESPIAPESPSTATSLKQTPRDDSLMLRSSSNYTSIPRKRKLL